MIGTRRLAIGACAAMAAVGAVDCVRAAGIIDLGPSAGLTISQPIVQTQVGGFDTMLNEYLLDTGASGIVVGKSASDELRGAGLQTVATYYDFGIGGFEPTQVTLPYDFRFAGSDGAPLTLPSTRIQTTGGNFGFYAGIAGMPLMIGRTVGLDLAAQARDLDAGGRIGVAFGSGAPPSLPRQHSVPLRMYEFPMNGQVDPADPLPVYAPLPFAPVEVQYGRHRGGGDFLVDTGAMLSILSSKVAFDIGMDVNGNGSLEDDAVDFLEVAGVGGSVFMPVFTIDALSIRAAGGVDLMLRTMTVGVLDIDDALPGVLGIDVLNSGWDIYALNLFLGLEPGPAPPIDRVDFDFRTSAATLTGDMRVTLSAGSDVFVSQGPLTLGSATEQPQAALGHRAIGGTGPLTIDGPGAVILDAVNTLTGTTTVRAGTLRIAEPNALFGSPVVVSAAASVDVAQGVVARLPSLTLAGGSLSAGAVAVNGTSGIARLVLESGTITGAPALSVGVGGVLTLPRDRQASLATTTLVVDETAGGRIDIGMGRISIATSGSTTAADLRSDLIAGRGAGNFGGAAGIMTSAPAAGTATHPAVGYRVYSSGSAVVAWAAFGDASLDGEVSQTDINLLVGGGRFGQGTSSGAVWAQGDFNYSGGVTQADINLMVTTGLFGGGSYLPVMTSGGGIAVATVPEPRLPMVGALMLVLVVMRRPGLPGLRASRWL